MVGYDGSRAEFPVGELRVGMEVSSPLDDDRFNVVKKGLERGLAEGREGDERAHQERGIASIHGSIDGWSKKRSGASYTIMTFVFSA